MIQEAFQLSINSIKQQKVRSWLTMLGIFIGIASVTALLSLSGAVNSTIQKQFEMIGSNKILILPGGGNFLMSFVGGGTSTLTIDDVKNLERLASIKSASYYVFQSNLVKFKSQTESMFIMGITPEIASDLGNVFQGMEIVKGRSFKTSDKNVALVGYDLWAGTAVLDRPVRLRETITIDGANFEIVGFMSQIGNRQDDSSIYIPYDQATEMFNKKNTVDFLMLEVSPGFKLDNIVGIVEDRLRKLHGVKKGEEDFSVQTSENLIAIVGAIISLVQFVFIGVAMISIVVGGVGIMNTMYTSVMERTKQIGVMKAVGAKDSQILTIFMIESGVYGFVGGLIGGLAGFGFAKIIEIGLHSEGSSFLNFNITFSPIIIIGVLSFSFLVGVISGVLPARQASKMNPVDALRYE